MRPNMLIAGLVFAGAFAASYRTQQPQRAATAAQPARATPKVVVYKSPT